MVYITYTSSRGTLTAGTRAHLPLTLCALSGLAPPMREYTVQSYLGIDGQETVSSRLLPRTVTMSIERKPDCGMLPRDIYRLLSEAGTLYIRREDCVYKIHTNQAIVSEEVKNGDFRVYTAQYVCDDPYFTDEKLHHVSCFELTDHIRYEKDSETWTLGTSEEPVIWTSTGSTQRILNNGDTPIEPILTVVGVGQPDDDAYIDLKLLPYMT